MAVCGVVVDLSDGWRETIVAPIATEACVIGHLLRVVPEVYLVIRLQEAPGTQNDLGLAIPLEACSWNDIEYAIRAIADVRRVAAPLDLDVVDVLRIDLRAKIAGNVGVWNL